MSTIAFWAGLVFAVVMIGGLVGFLVWFANDLRRDW